MGACYMFEDGRGAMLEEPRGTGTPSSDLHVIDTANNNNNSSTSHRHTPPSQSSVQAHDDTQRAPHTMIQTTSGNQKTTTTTTTTATARRSFGTFAVALSHLPLLLALALAPSSVVVVGASTPVSQSSSLSSSCVQITDTALYSSCASGGKKAAALAFTMEGTTAGTTAANTGGTETGGLRAKVATIDTIAARPGGFIVPCLATGVVVTVGFAAPVTSIAYPDDPSSGANVATFYAETLESNPTEFAVVLDTTGVAAGTNVVTYVEYSDNEGNSPDMSGLMDSLASTLECDDHSRSGGGGGGGGRDAAGATTGVSRELEAGLEYECNACFDLTPHQVNVLDMYDNGGKEIVCDETCLDDAADHTHCNYFDLGQICRGCGDCSTCHPCPAPGEAPAPTPNDPEASVTKPPYYDVTSRTAAPAGMDSQLSAAMLTSAIDAGDGGDEYEAADPYDCSRCTDISSAQKEALASYDNGGKKIICDPTCMDTISDHIYCNYFGLGQICRACGDCSTCIACPTTDTGDSSPAPAPAPGSAKSPASVIPATPTGTPSPVTSAPAVDSTSGVGSGKTFTHDGDDDDEEEEEGDDDECAPCMDLTEGQVRALASWDNGGKRVVCDPTCVDDVSDRTHCNYYNLGDICRGCGDCTDCTPCP